MKTYHGRVLLNGEERVTVGDGRSGMHRSLAPRFDLRSHSPTGFSWGYGGSGPSQLALAILADFTGDDAEALRFYQQFKWAFVSNWPERAGWNIDGKQIGEWLDQERSRASL